MDSELLVMTFIFFARVLDVSIGTVRIIMISRGLKFIAPLLGFVEVLVWLTAISWALKTMSSYYSYLIYAAGFATGNYAGMILEEKLAIGYQTIRVITTFKATKLPELLRKYGFSITELDGRGMDGEVTFIYTVVAKKDVKQVLELINKFHPKAFITIEDVRSHYGGYVSKNNFLQKFGLSIAKKK